MKLGVFVTMQDIHVEEEFRKVHEMGFTTCQLNCWNIALLNRQTADSVLKASGKYGVEITSFWCGWEGPGIWNFTEGPVTLGLVPSAYRFERLKGLLAGADFADAIQVKNLVTHVGFIPENPNDPHYKDLLAALAYLVEYCSKLDLVFNFETGQETPVTLLRTIEDIGRPNVGVNLDPANLILYGKANPVDALDILGPYVRGVHAKDAVYPTTGRNLGQEVPLGEGKVNITALVAKLQDIGYDGALTIEREIAGEAQVRDILRAKKLLESLL